MAVLCGVAILRDALASCSADPMAIGYGLGGGQMYGWFGVNAEQVAPKSQLVDTAGLGSWGGLGWQIGARYYFTRPTAEEDTGHV